MGASRPIRTGGWAHERAAGVLAINTLGFALCLAAWVIFGPSSRLIAVELGLSPTAGVMLKSLPILVGSLTRIPVGVLSDRFGAHILFPGLMGAGAAALVVMSFAHSLTVMLGAAAVLGLIGASFAVGAQSVSCSTPRHKQGGALGVFGAGNAGMAVTTLGLPPLLVAHGWRLSFQLYAACLVLALIIYAWMVHDAPRCAVKVTFGELMSPLASAVTWRLGLYYMASFGVVVGGTLALSDLYIDCYGISATAAGYLVTSFTVTASLMRIVGGRLADRTSPRRVVQLSMLVAGLMLLPVGLGVELPLVVVAPMLFIAALALGSSMAATMKYVAALFPGKVGTVTGILGALGGLGGFLLPLAGQATRRLWPHAFAEVFPMLLLIGAALVAHWRARAVDQSTASRAGLTAELQQRRGRLAAR